MKILYVVTQPELGGAQKYVLDLACALGGMVACGTGNGLLPEQAKKLGLITYSVRHLQRSINLQEDLKAVWELRQLVREIRPDIVHLNSSKAGILGSLACIGTGAKVVYTAHGFVFNEPLPPLLKWAYVVAEWLASYFRDHIIAVSEADRQSALRYLIADPENISVIYNGIGHTELLDRATARTALGLSQSAIAIGTIGHFYRNKGFDVLIDALARLPKGTLEKIQTAIIGQGTEFAACMRQIEAAGLEPYVVLPGAFPNAARYLKAFDMFVLPSRKEGFSYTLLEAMQAGLPVIATSVGGNREALGGAGLTVPPESPEALAQALDILIASPETRAQFGNQAQTKSSRFTLEAMVKETEILYNSLLGK